MDIVFESSYTKARTSTWFSEYFKCLVENTISKHPYVYVVLVSPRYSEAEIFRFKGSDFKPVTLLDCLNNRTITAGKLAKVEIYVSNKDIDIVDFVKNKHNVEKVSISSRLGF